MDPAVTAALREELSALGMPALRRRAQDGGIQVAMGGKVILTLPCLFCMKDN